MQTKTGTCHFPSLAHALKYYRPYFGGGTLEEVKGKIRDGAIFIGKPPIKEGESLSIEDCRYHIITSENK